MNPQRWLDKGITFQIIRDLAGYFLQARKLLHCLSSASLHRWCTYEWFYSAIDYPWFMNNVFVNYLNFAKLSHLSRFTRSEWSTIQSSLGKPRHFSDHFLVVENEKLEDYHENVRKYYALLSHDSRDSQPADLARPFSIGQQVIVRHPSTRELCDSKVVMMERDCYKVQFDKPDLGVDIVKDTDCMPVSWLDNLPDDHKRRNSLSNNAHRKLESEHIPKLTPKESWDHTMNGLSISEPSKSLQVTSDEQLKQLSESRYPPANVAGVLESASSMLRPSCSENLTIYNDIENCISVVKNQILALVPTTSGFAAV